MGRQQGGVASAGPAGRTPAAAPQRPAETVARGKGKEHAWLRGGSRGWRPSRPHGAVPRELHPGVQERLTPSEQAGMVVLVPLQGQEE